MAAQGKLARYKVPLIIGAVIVAVLGLGGFLILHGASSGASTTQYTTGKVTKGDLEKTLSVSGTLEAGSTTDVTPAVSGTVSAVKVKLGDTVAAGQVLFTIKNDSLDTAVEQAADNVTSAKLQLTSAQAQLTAAQTSTTSSTSSATASSSGDQSGAGGSSSGSNGSSLTSSASQIASAKAQAATAKSSLATAQQNYDDAVEQAAARTVTAPCAGVVTSLNVTADSSVGSSGSTGSTGSGSTGSGDASGGAGGDSSSSSSSTGSSSAAATISNYASSMVATIDVTEAELPSLKVGMTAKMSFDALSSVTATGTITQIAPTGTSSSGLVTFPVQITVANPDSKLRPGMNTTAKIVLASAKDTLIVPNGAITSTGTNTGTVMVVTDTSTMATKQVTVKLGTANDTSTAVLSGLSEGDTVITGTVDTSSSSSSNSTNAMGGMGGPQMQMNAGSTRGTSAGGMGGPGGN